MSAPVLFQPLKSVAPWQVWSTPQKLWGSLYLIWGLDALLLIAAITGVHVHRDAMKTIGKDTAPSIIAAQRIKSAMADMDANAANEFLGDPGKMPEAVSAYEQRRIEAATALIEAAKNITYGDKEQRPIESIQVGLGTFEARVQRARDLHERGDAGVVNAYRDAAKLMDETLLPEADKLDSANNDVLEEIYSAVSDQSLATVVFLVIAGAVFLWALVIVQKFLTARTHRVLNPMLLLATLVTVVFVIYTFSTLGAERHRLKVAKEDAFDSIRALWRARAVAYAANADESRYLLDGVHAPDHESAFSTKAAVVKEGLDKELHNITFEGEQDAATMTLANFSEYLRIDKEIRRLQQNKQHADAIELCIGTRPGESNAAFAEFDKALGKTLGINQDNFDLAVTQGFESLSYFELKAAIVAIGIALLAFAGLLTRIREYS